MKFVSVAIFAAFLCVAAVSAAPTDMEKDLEKWHENMEDASEMAVCAVYVKSKEGSYSAKLRKSFEETKKAIANLEVEVKQCKNLSCRHPLHEGAARIWVMFFSVLESVDPEIFEKIEKSGCLRDSVQKKINVMDKILVFNEGARLSKQTLNSNDE